MPAEKPTLVIGDVHGHYDRIEALLQQEGIIDDKAQRINRDVEVIQLGDLGHFGHSSDAAGDARCFAKAENWFDFLLWGNHDRAVVDRNHMFGGFREPDRHPEIKQVMNRMEYHGRLKFAHAVHGYLLTHAGLHAEWKFHPVPDGIRKDNPYETADYINSGKDTRLRDMIGASRGGMARVGGVLWRDFSEKLYNGFPQVFGHSASHKHKVRQDPTNLDSYCVDVGGKGGHDRPEANCLAAIWLPDRRIVRIDLGDKYREVFSTEL